MGWYTDNFGDTEKNRERDRQAASGGSAKTDTKTSTNTNASGGGRTSSGRDRDYSSSPVTDMSQWYRDTQAAQGGKPTAEQVKAAMDSYRDYVAGKTNPSSGSIYSAYGERIGNTGTGRGGYTDFSKSAANAIVNPGFVKTPSNDYSQRYLTATSGLEPGFADYSKLPGIADNWLQDNPDSFWDQQGLVDLWKSKYSDIGTIPGLMNKYSNEFAGGAAPSLQPLAPITPLGTSAGAVIGAAVPVSASGNVLGTIADYQKAWQDAYARGDKAGMDAAHAAAEATRASMGYSGGADGSQYLPLTPADNLYTEANALLAKKNPDDLFQTNNQYLQAYLDSQKAFSDYPAYEPPEREEFEFAAPPVSITSSGDDVHIPTLAAKQQWEAQQNAIQDRALQQYGVDYDRNKNIYTTQADLLKLAMAEQQRQEAAAADAVRWQAEQAIKDEETKYNRAWNLWVAGAPTEEVYATLGIPPGTKPIEQILAEKDAALKEYKASISGSRSSGGGSLYSAAINEMLSGQSRHRQALLSGEKRNPHSYNYYVSQAIELSNKTGNPLSRTEIEALRKQADYLASTDEDWAKTQISSGRLPQRRPVTNTVEDDW